MPRSIPYDAYLIRSLRNRKEAEAYLNAALQEEDPRVFLLVLRDVAQARGGPRTIREHLARMAARRGGPSLHELGPLLSRLGIRLAIQAKTAA